MPSKDLREFVHHLQDVGDLLRIQEEVDPKYEIAAYLRKAFDTGGPALWFDRVKGCDTPVVGGLFASRERVLRALEISREGAVPRFLDALEARIPTQRVTAGPCQEVVHLHEDVDLAQFPNPTYCIGDGGPYITAGVVISRDPVDGGKNTSMYRIQVTGRNRLGILSSAQHHLFLHYQKAEAMGQPLDVAIALGCAPAILIATQWEAPYGVDELELAGALMGGPVETVKCRTVDLEVPAAAEIVIEGAMLPQVRELEGPLGEYTGYYSEASPKPVIQVTAITHRHRPVYQALQAGPLPNENNVIKQIPLEAGAYSALRGRFPGVTAVHFPEAGGVALMVIVAIRQHARHEARNVIMSLFSHLTNKIVIVVDDDIDIYDMDHVMWAVCTRCQPDRDVIIVPNLSGAFLDPSSSQPGANNRLGMDATRPFGEPFPEVPTVAGIERVPDLNALLARQQGGSAEGQSLGF
jgi:UbiD family decarboxylase